MTGSKHKQQQQNAKSHKKHAHKRRKNEDDDQDEDEEDLSLSELEDQMKETDERGAYTLKSKLQKGTNRNLIVRQQVLVEKEP